jgi:hypothetical protein
MFKFYHHYAQCITEPSEQHLDKFSFEKIQKLNVARLNKFGFSKVPSCDTLCKSCYHISGRSVPSQFAFKYVVFASLKNCFLEKLCNKTVL